MKKAILSRETKRSLTSHGLTRCPGKWCPGEIIPLDEYMLKNHYCRVCSSMRRRAAYAKRKSNPISEPERTKRMRLRGALPHETFLCFGKLCLERSKDGIRHNTEDGYDNRTCKICTWNVTKNSRKALRSMRVDSTTCAKCGENNPILIEQNHIDPSTKSRQTSSVTGVHSMRIELKKTEPLCINCHRNVTFMQWQKKIKDFAVLAENAFRPDVAVKKCNGVLCKSIDRIMPIGCFSKNPKTRDGLQTACRFCCGKYQQLLRRRNYNHVVSKKVGISRCQTCAMEVTEENSHVFDFDHIDRFRKTSAVAKLASRASDARHLLDLEISKCRLLCANCHKIHTARQMNYYQ